MYCENKLRAKMAERGILNVSDLCDATGIKYSTMLRRIGGYAEWERSEITTVAEVLELSNEDIINIFFAE